MSKLETLESGLYTKWQETDLKHVDAAEKKYLVLVRLIHQMSGLSLGMVIVLWHNPVADFVLVHLTIFV